MGNNEHTAKQRKTKQEAILYYGFR